MGDLYESSPMFRHGAVWLTMLGMAVGGIWWAAGLAGKVENQQAQISALQAEVANRRGVIDLVENVQRDVARLERAQDRLHEEVDKRADEGEGYKELIARMAEHLRTLDERMAQVERSFGWRAERGLGSGPDAR
jgi:peptidoglycan hydrolase CwlO-like protein